jgi:hypothetical protein
MGDEETTNLNPQEIAACAAYQQGLQDQLEDNAEEKGGWDNCDPKWLMHNLNRKVAELGELAVALAQPDPAAAGMGKNLNQRLFKKACAVGNYAMMVCDVVGALPTEMGAVEVDNKGIA